MMRRWRGGGLALAVLAAGLMAVGGATAAVGEERYELPRPAGEAEPIRAAPGGGEMMDAGARFRHVTGATVDRSGRARVGCTRETPGPAPTGDPEAP